jgi:alkyldihydroxyacetonephosphate synthase
MSMLTNRGAPTPPIALAGDPAGSTDRLMVRRVEVDDTLLQRLRGVCSEVTTDAATVTEASRDWWPLALHAALDNQVLVRAAAVVRPADAGEVAALLRVCDEARLPVTVAAGRSGVCGASVPLHGGVVLDLTALAGVRAVDAVSLVVDVLPGTFGDVFEDDLRASHGLTVGHWPQSMSLSTVGGWLACRGAGQYSTRYGKIEDIVTGLDVVLADGTALRTGGAPRAATGPDLTQLFVGSEGTLGVIVGARLRAHRVPAASARAAFAFATFDDGNDACRRIVQRGATPAVLRLYDAIEGDRSYQTGDHAVLLVFDEADPAILDATMAIVRDECAAAEPLDDELVDRWFKHRNDVSALAALTEKGYVVDTMEVAGRWRVLPDIYARTLEALRAAPHMLVASAHQSHSYADGACLYFTFAAKPPAGAAEETYRSAWDAGQRAVLAAGGALSHHHGVGMNRARFMAEALGAGLDLLAAVKAALDPHGILNPGKLGLPDPWGAADFP